MHPNAHRMAPGAVSFIPGWIMLFITILIIAVLFPSLFTDSNIELSSIINVYLFAFIIGSLMPAFDDMLAFLFGPPFAHHSLFHSFIGSLLTYLLFVIFKGPDIALYAFFGTLYHIFFNFYLDYVTPFFPFTYREFGLSDFIKVSTYWIKVIHYPIILLLFFIAVFIFL